MTLAEVTLPCEEKCSCYSWSVVPSGRFPILSLAPIDALLELLTSHHDFVLLATVPKLKKAWEGVAADAVYKRSTLASDSIQIN